MKSTLKKLLIITLGMFAAFVLLMTLSFCIPNSAVEANTQKGLTQLNTEIKNGGNDYWPMATFPWYACELDGYTDEIMLEMNLLHESDSPFIASLTNGGRSYHWHGYQIFLRPLLVVFDYMEIRFINYLLIFALLAAVMLISYKKLNVVFASAVGLGFFKVFGFIMPSSIQFVSPFAVALVAMLVILLRFEREQKDEFYYIVFFLTGALTNFFDTLTTPPLSIGLPLLVLIALEIKQQRRSPKKLFFFSFALSVAWTAGYLIANAQKWLMSVLFIGKNDVASGTSAAIGYMFSSDRHFGFIKMYLYQIYNLLEPMKVTLPIIAAIIIVWVVLFVKYRNKGIQTAYIPTVLFVSLYPYLWYTVFMTHSGMHFWFTYRNQFITVVGVLYAMYLSVEWQKLRQAREAHAQKKREKETAWQ